MRGRISVRWVMALAVATATVAGCQSEPSTRQPADSGFWSEVPQSDEQRAEVAERIRQVEVCALLPRDALATVGTIRSVRNDQPYSCTAEIEAEDDVDDTTTLGWTSMTAWEPRSADYGSTRRVGDVTVWTVADSDMPGARIDPDARTRSCSTTSRFPSGAAVYLDIEVSAGGDPCPALDELVPAMLDRWRTEPHRGSSPDVRPTVLPGADPCAVRQRLSGTEDEGQVQTNVCSFRYRGEFVRVAFEYRMRDTVTAAHTEVHIGGRTVHRSNLHAETDPYRTYVAVVGPELSPAQPTDTFGPEVPVLVVDAESDEVTSEVMEKALALLP